MYGIYNKATNEEVKSFKGLQNNVDLVAGGGRHKDFSGVLFVGAEDVVLRKSESVPSCECVLMSMCWLSHEECEQEVDFFPHPFGPTKQSDEESLINKKRGKK